MRTNAKKRFLACLVAFLMVFTCIPAAAYAAEGDLFVLDGQVTISDSLATAAEADGVVTLTAAGGNISQKTNTVTVTNNTAKTATLTFDFLVENYKEYTGLDSDNGTLTQIVDAGAAVTITFTGKKANTDNTAVMTLSNFAIETVADASELTFSYDSKLGSITVAGEAATSGTVKTTTYAEGLALTATAAEGAEFMGWINEETGKIFSREAAFTIKPTNNATVKAVFADGNTGSLYLAGNSYIFSDLDEATAKAAVLKEKVVVLLNDVTLTGTNTIPAGVTLLVPFDAENTLYTVTPEAVHGSYATPVAYRTLTLADGAELIVNGAVSLSAKHNAANGGARGSGSPTGDVSFLEMGKDSTVTIKDGGAFYAYGFVTGEGTVKAESGATVYENFQIEDFRGGTATTYVAVNESAKGVLPIAQYYVQNIEVPLTLEAGATEYCYTSLFLSSKCLGSSVKFISDAGAMFILEEGSVTKSYDGATDRLMVEGNGNMSLSPIKVEMDGQGIDSATFELPINHNITVGINTGNVEINQDIALLPGSEIKIAEGATCTLGEGVSVYVYDLDQWGAYCGSANETLIPVIYAPGKKYNRTVNDLNDAAIEVNGTLDASAGALYTTTSEDYSNGNANIYSTGNGTVKIVSGEQECTYQFTQNGGEGTFTEVFLLPANLVNGDGSFVQTLDATAGTYTYANGTWGCSHAVATEKVTQEATCTTDGYKTVTCSSNPAHTYVVTIPAGHELTDVEGKPATCTEAGYTAYKACANCDYIEGKEVIEATGHSYGDWIVEKDATCTAAGLKYKECACGHKVSEEIAIQQHTYTAVVTAPTCEAEGYTTFTCTCGDSYVADKVAALGHKEVADAAVEATCTATGLTAGKRCSVCDKVLVEQKVVDKKPHTEAADAAVAPTCEATGLTAGKHCSVCNEVLVKQEVVAALGHKEVVDAAVAATCTATGLTEGKHCSVCEKVLTAQQTVAMTAHAWETEYTVDKAATLQGPGSKSYHCADCGTIDTASVIKIKRIKTVTVAALTFNGLNRTPNPVIKDFGGKQLKRGTDYTVVYKNAKGTKVVKPRVVGKYTAQITFKGDYSDVKSVKFNINPKGVGPLKLSKKGKKQFTAKWTKRTTQVTGYQIKYGLKGKVNGTTVTIKNFKNNTRTIKGLKSKKTYWVQVRSYKTVNGVKYFSNWTPKKTIKIN